MRKKTKWANERHWSFICMGVAALIFGGFILTMEVARAETIVVSDVIPARNTNWSDVLEIPAFEHQWGMLTSITLTFMTPITGFVSFENKVMNIP